MADRTVIEYNNWQSHDVVARNDAGFWETFFGANFNLGSDSSNRPGYRSARQCRKNLNGGVPSQNADWSPSGGIP